MSKDCPLQVGIVGCGVISTVYFEAGERFADLQVVACADQLPARAELAAERHQVRSVPSLEHLLADPEVEAVLNLTPPLAHGAVSSAALGAGKHVYSEKPLGATTAEARELLALAGAAGLRLGCAPDTFLGAGLQTCRQLIDEGAIGEPVAASASLLTHGPDHWHPDPQFFYRPGAGPLLDMGPYYVTALVSLLGPVAAVAAAARASSPQRLVRSGPRAGELLSVETPTHVAGLLELASGPIVTLTTSFDVWASDAPRIEVYGSEGTLSVPDPNRFGGPVRLWREGGPFAEVPLERPYAEQSRGLGLADLAAGLAAGRPHRADGQLAYHVLDVLESLLAAAEDGGRRLVSSATARPAPLPADLLEGASIP